jgi:hypothetical protein
VEQVSCRDYFFLPAVNNDIASRVATSPERKVQVVFLGLDHQVRAERNIRQLKRSRRFVWAGPAELRRQSSTLPPVDIATSIQLDDSEKDSAVV